MHKRRRRIVIWITFRNKLRVLLGAAAILVLIAFFTYDLPFTKTWEYWQHPLNGKVIVLDPGHGGPDGGAVSKSGIQEKEITLTLTKYLRDYLQQAGAIVYLTRETDTDLAGEHVSGSRKRADLTKRAEIIREKKADLFLTIHLNAIPGDRWRGAQTFYVNNHPDNRTLAVLIQNELVTQLGNTNRVAKEAPHEVYLLNTSQVPSALVEAGFLSNPAEAQLLADEKYQQKVAASVYRGIMRYVSGEKLGSDTEVLYNGQ